jgi:hypothetical protein
MRIAVVLKSASTFLYTIGWSYELPNPHMLVQVETRNGGRDILSILY